MDKYFSHQWKHVLRSARGELFNFLVYPFLLVTLSYGIGFGFFGSTKGVGESSLFRSMTQINPIIPMLWGWLAIAVIIAGFYVLLFDKPPVGLAVALSGFMLWFFAAGCYIATGGWLTLFSVAIPSMLFWGWQYFSLAEFRRQEKQDSSL